MSAANLLKISAALNVRPDWLGRGEGTPQRYQAAAYTEDALLATFRQLNVRERVLLRDVMDSILRAREAAPEGRKVKTACG